MLKELFEKNKNIIINTDIDGILSGIILVKYCGCKIVGFTNSKDSVWLADGYDDLFKHIYIDMFVTDENTICIDQHVVALTDEHMTSIRNSGTKFSPQSDDPNNLRTFTSWGFKNKYPFGTTQYIIAQLEQEGVIIDFNPNTRIENSKITIGDLIHRADDAMKTSLYAYKNNADNWWRWLENKAPNGSIKKLTDYLDAIITKCDECVNNRPIQNGRRHKKNEYFKEREEWVTKIKENTKEYFKTNFQCGTSDGGFNKITDDNNNLLPNIRKYISTISSLFGLKDIVIPQHYNVHKGIACRTRWLDIFKDDFLKDYTICGHKIFSYAFIYGPDNDGQTNFSFTIDMN